MDLEVTKASESRQDKLLAMGSVCSNMLLLRAEKLGGKI